MQVSLLLITTLLPMVGNQRARCIYCTIIFSDAHVYDRLSRLQVNCLASSLLALLLLPRMVQTAHDHSTTPRLVVVSSDLHYMTSIEKSVTDNPNILQTLSNKEYCTPQCVEIFCMFMT